MTSCSGLLCIFKVGVGVGGTDKWTRCEITHRMTDDGSCPSICLADEEKKRKKSEKRKKKIERSEDKKKEKKEREREREEKTEEKASRRLCVSKQK